MDIKDVKATLLHGSASKFALPLQWVAEMAAFPQDGEVFEEATKVSPFALPSTPMLARARRLALKLALSKRETEAMIFQGLLCSFAKASAFGKPWAMEMFSKFAQGDLERPARGYLISEADDFLFAPDAAALCCDLLESAGTGEAPGGVWEEVTSDEAPVSFLLLKFVGLLLLELGGEPIFKIAPAGNPTAKPEEWSDLPLWEPTFLSLLVVATEAVRFQCNSTRASGKVPTEKQRGVGKREFFENHNLILQGPALYRMGNQVVNHSLRESALFAQWCQGGLCDQNHLMVVRRSGVLGVEEDGEEEEEPPDPA